MISAVVLASARVETTAEQKSLVPFQGKPPLQIVLECALASELDEVVCVADELESARRHIKLVDDRLLWLKNDAPGRGRSKAVIAGLWAVNPTSDGAMFLFSDQPFVGKELINALIDRFKTNTAPIVAPCLNREPRNPVLFRRPLFPELLQLTGDRDGQSLLDVHREHADLVDWPDEASFLCLEASNDDKRLKNPA